MTDLTLGAAHQTLRDEVTAELRRRILSGALAQGERLVEDRLAALLGVSRNPVRESIRVLAAEGFVQVVPRLGATVARLRDCRPRRARSCSTYAWRSRASPRGWRRASGRQKRPSGCGGCSNSPRRPWRPGGWRRWRISTPPSTWPWARRRATPTSA
ncbi:GntR family transcriptional regulator [Nonomuraea sp. K274]|uniref:GntR family transcriptional regulator n=1 Tax=Nonomuraea cypriaca TaxID=1187855 RepID=A0A931AD61_9ACTN|nr:GntR family transcriptional regulator [Nonomuraea cypriaca]